MIAGASKPVNRTGLTTNRLAKDERVSNIASTLYARCSAFVKDSGLPLAGMTVERTEKKWITSCGFGKYTSISIQVNTLRASAPGSMQGNLRIHSLGHTLIL